MDLIESIHPVHLVLGFMTGISAYILQKFLPQLMDHWMKHPVVATSYNASLVFYETNKEVLLPILNAAKQLAKTIQSALMLVISIVRPLILLAMNLTKSLVKMSQELGVSFSYTMESFGSKIFEFAKALGVVLRGLASVLYSLTMSLSYVISSFERVTLFSYKVFFETRQVTLEDLYSVFVPFVVVGTVLGVMAWWMRPTSVPQCVPSKPRRSQRLQRKRAMMMCKDLSLPTSKETASSTNL